MAAAALGELERRGGGKEFPGLACDRDAAHRPGTWNEIDRSLRLVIGATGESGVQWSVGLLENALTVTVSTVPYAGWTPECSEGLPMAGLKRFQSIDPVVTHARNATGRCLAQLPGRTLALHSTAVPVFHAPSATQTLLAAWCCVCHGPPQVYARSMARVWRALSRHYGRQVLSDHRIYGWMFRAIGMMLVIVGVVSVIGGEVLLGSSVAATGLLLIAQTFTGLNAP